MSTCCMLLRVWVWAWACQARLKGREREREREAGSVARNLPHQTSQVRKRTGRPGKARQERSTHARRREGGMSEWSMRHFACDEYRRRGPRDPPYHLCTSLHPDRHTVEQVLSQTRPATENSSIEDQHQNQKSQKIPIGSQKPTGECPAPPQAPGPNAHPQPQQQRNSSSSSNSPSAETPTDTGFPLVLPSPPPQYLRGTHGIVSGTYLWT